MVNVLETMTTLTDADRVRLLTPPPPIGRVRAVLDTDTYNEIDDQYALAYAMLASERIQLEAIYAAPFHNNRSSGPGDGMRRSYEEIGRVLDRIGSDETPPVFEGSTSWLPARTTPVASPAADDLIARAKTADDPLYVIAIGAPTNVASALLSAPDIARQIVVVWLGGQPTYWPDTTEFNLAQDLHASHVLLDSGVPLVRVPCRNVTEHVRTTLAEVDRFVRPAGKLGAYLAEIFEAYLDDHYGRSKQIWDLGAVGWLVNSAWAPSHLVHSPILTSECTWSHDPRRHLVREVSWVDRDALFADLFRRLGDHA
ncbi:MAG TPA: nucleoside hydrolase [Actinopolymorphaceae bacterium]|jgi:hypothetical protein